MHKKITTHLWYDKEAKEAAAFYVDALGGESKITSSSVLTDTPSGTVDILNINLRGEEFTLISAGPIFKFNPSISLSVPCKTKEEVDALWAKLSVGGKVRMELGEYPWSARYGWTDDKYGLSWQIIFVGDWEIKQGITPQLMFTQHMAGKAEEAMNFYVSVFKDSKLGGIARYEKGEPDKEGTIKHAAFTIEGQEFYAMDSSGPHDFVFNEAISFVVHCADQAEIDYYWKKLSADPKSEQCGWLKDKYGVSWQIVPKDMDEMMGSGDPARRARVTQAFLKMKKFDLAKLKEAAEGNNLESSPAKAI